MEEEIRTKIQTLNEERELETQTGLETINTEKVRLNDAVSQARKSEATMREETNVRMCNFTAQNEYVIQRVRDKTTAGAATIDLKTKKLANELITTTKLQNEQDVASASLLSAKNQVAADKKLTEAEGVTADWTKKSKNFMTDLKKIDVFDSLASNENMILGSLSDDDGNIVTITDKILEDNSSKLDDLSPTSVAAELALLKCSSRGNKNDDTSEKLENSSENLENPADKYFDTTPK